MKKTKLLKKIAALVIACMAAITAFAGCVDNSVRNDPSTLEISFWKSGYGVEFINRIIEGFENEYPQYKVVLNVSSNNAVFSSTIRNGGDANSIDLYMTTALGEAYREYYEPLDDVLSYTVPGESITISEKLSPDMMAALKLSDGKNYALPYGSGLLSIAYNTDIIDGTTYKEPRTTDELYSLAMRLKAGGITPFIHFANGGYWPIMATTWQVQHSGEDYFYNNYLHLKDSEGNSPSKAILLNEDKSDGRYQVLTVLEKILHPQYVVSGSNSGIFTSQQTKFLSGHGAMMSNGTWLYNEMKTNSGANNFSFRLMKTPVISTIIDRLEEVEDDRELSALIAAVDAAGADRDAVAVSGSGYSVSQRDVDDVFRARNLMFNISDENVMVIPKYSTAKEAAKEFIKYVYSDPVIKQTQSILHMPFPAKVSDGSGVDTTGWNEWEVEQLALYNNTFPIYKNIPNMSSLFRLGGASAYAGINYVLAFSSTNPADRLTANQVWSRIIDSVNDNWQSYLYKAGS